MNNKNNVIKGSTLVVGADSDIGAALIRQLSGDIIAHYYISRAVLDELHSETRNIIPVFGDLSFLDGIKDFIAKIKEIDLPISKIVHLPSSPAVPERLPKVDPISMQNEFNIQAVSAAMIFSEFLPLMAKRNFGRVVVMLTSYCIGTPPKYLTGYLTAKYALMGLMKSAAVEYAGKGIIINAVAPSMTETKFLSTLPDFEIQASAKSNPMGRNAVPDDLIPVFKMLLNDDTEFLTGTIIPVTGGSNLP